MPEQPKIKQPYHPVIQLRFGDSPFIVTIPPQHLVEFTATERRGGRDQATIVFIDPTFTRLESMLLQLDRNRTPRTKKDVDNSALFYRWGFPGLGLENRVWKQGIMATYTPTLTTSGMRITIDIWAVGTQFSFLVQPKTYYGKISDVVTQVALEMGYPKSNIFVEETNDDDNAEVNQPWPIHNLSRPIFIESLVFAAVSKENPQKPYFFRLAMDNTFHFHTVDFSRTKRLKRATPRIFKTLFGDPETAVISFSPSYNAKKIGSVGQAVLGTTYDPRTKQFQKRVYTRKNLGLASQDDPKNARTTAGALVASTDVKEQEKKVNAAVYKQSQQTSLGGACSGKTRHQYTSPESAFSHIENSFKILHETITGAQLELSGIPGLEDFSADEYYCDIHVVLPPEAVEYSINSGANEEIDQILNKFGLEHRYGLHWSSGRYQIKNVVHTITSGYVISVELFRPTNLAGPDEARTGPPKKPKLTTTPTT